MPSNPLDRVAEMFALSGMISARSGPGNTAEDLGLAGAKRRAERVTVSVPARLHFGFMDLNGNLGRRFGSLGVGLEAPLTRVTLAPGTELEGSGEDADRARQYLLKLL